MRRLRTPRNLLGSERTGSAQAELLSLLKMKKLKDIESRRVKQWQIIYITAEEKMRTTRS